MRDLGVSMLDLLWNEASPEDTSIADHIVVDCVELLKAYPGRFRKLQECSFGESMVVVSMTPVRVCIPLNRSHKRLGGHIPLRVSAECDQ